MGTMEGHVAKSRSTSSRIRRTMAKARRAAAKARARRASMERMRMPISVRTARTQWVRAKMRKERTVRKVTTLSSKGARGALLRRFLMTPRELMTTITKTGLPWLIEGGSGGEDDEQDEKDEQEEEGARREDIVT